MLLDYWRRQPELGQGPASSVRLNDVFRYLLYEPLGLTGTYFIEGSFGEPHSVMGEFFDMNFFDIRTDDSDDNPADLALASTGSDMMKVALVALRRGRLPDGSWFVSEEQWQEWAGKNKLPGGKYSQALAHWRMEGRKIPFLWRTALTRTVNSGPYGWNYFGATYHNYEGEGDAG